MSGSVPVATTDKVLLRAGRAARACVCTCAWGSAVECPGARIRSLSGSAAATDSPSLFLLFFLLLFSLSLSICADRFALMA